MPRIPMPGSGLVECLEPRTLFAAAPTAPPVVQFHLTARPWAALDTQANDYLAKAEQLARVLAAHQNAQGEIVDPYTGEQEKASTPYFAYVVAVLNSAGRATDLFDRGVLAMDEATLHLTENIDGSDDSGNNYLEPLSNALTYFAPLVPQASIDAWRQRMVDPIGELIDDNPNNHRAYAMKGEWSRALAGLVPHDSAVAFVEENWKSSQRDRIAGDALGLYHDMSSVPDSLAVESVGRVNLLWLVANGYDGPSRAEMESLLYAGTKNLLALQDPTGQAPTGGRASDAVWNDSNVGVCFEMMAKQSADAGDLAAAGVYRRAANLAFKSVQRWEMPDGSLAILKNKFDPADRVAWADFNVWTNGVASQAYRFASLYALRIQEDADKPRITEAATPSEIGGYAVRTDADFASAFLDVGGIQLELGLQGSTDPTHSRYWSVLGIDRISATGWDSRLGPSNGQRDLQTQRAVSFAPEFLKANGGWDRLSELPETYSATLSIDFVSPVLARASIDYAPSNASAGPTFHQSLVVTPDGILSSLTSSAAPGTFGMTLPILTSDGQTTLLNSYGSNIATVRYPDATDEQNFISLEPDPVFTTTDAPVRGAYGDIRPVRVVASGVIHSVFVYPRGGTQPSAQTVQATWMATPNGFSNALGRVAGNTYVGRTSAGGEGTGIDFDGDGTQDMTFSQSCVFVLQRTPAGKITNIEADRPVTMTMNGRTFNLATFAPLAVNLSAPPVSPDDAGNQPPEIALTAPEVATLNAAAPLSATVSDDGLPANSVTSVAWTATSGPGTVAFLDPGAASTSATFTALGTYVLRATASDGELSQYAEVTIVVADVSTVPPIASDDDAARPIGQAVDVDVRANDSNPANAPLTVAVLTQPGNGSASVNDHGTPADPSDDTIVYTPEPGFFGADSFAYRISDDAGPASEATVRVSVIPGAALVADPADATKTALVVVGTDESETFKFVKKKSQVSVLRNKVQVGELLDLPTGSILILAGGGNDIVGPGTLKSAAMLVFGGAGDDRLTGTKFNDTLIGGDGNDILNGAGGADLVVGGTGADGATGAAGDDVIVTGTSAFDSYAVANVAALRGVMAIWSSGDAYADRVAALEASAWAGNLPLDDGEADTANGSSGNDLFFANPDVDKVKRTPAETIVTP